MLHGEKVCLRAMCRDDLQRLWMFNNDLEVELAGGGDPPWPQSWERLQADFESSAAQGGRNGANFAVEADGTFIGICGLFNFDNVAATCELGITIGDRAYWGKGYGRETVSLLLDYAFRLLNQRRVWLRVNGNNERALRAYRAAGFVEEGRLRQHVWSDGAYRDLLLMGVLREEHQAT